MLAKLALIFALASSSLLNAAAGFTLVVADPPGVGFNDATPVAPVGGNPGTTLGQQRLNVFIRAAQIWGAELNSDADIEIEAAWPALPCNANGAVLGAAGAVTVIANAQGMLPGYWYPVALANKLAGGDYFPDVPDIVAIFNPNLGQPGCLTGAFFYLGLDGQTQPGRVDLLETVLHEFSHGLGFQTFTNGTTGQFCCSPNGPFLPAIYDRFLLDKTTGLHWDVMSPAQRAASGINNAGALVWDGSQVTGSVPAVLNPAAEIRVTAPANAAATFIAGPAQFGPRLTVPVTGELMPVTAGGGFACDPLTGFDALAVNGKIALINRGVCGFSTKVKNAQDAGAIGALVVNNAPGFPPRSMDGIDPSVTIKSALTTLQDGNALRALLRFRSRTNSGVFLRLGESATLRAGADDANRVYMFSPNPFQSGSSISHWDQSPFPNLLMEHSDTPETDLSVKPPGDLTLPLLLDIGW